MSRLMKPRSLECNSRIFKDVTRDFESIEMIWQKNLRKTSMIGRSHRRHEQEEFGDFEDLLTFSRPNPCFMLTLDAMIVRCHLFDVFPTSTNKICLFKTIVCIVCIPLYLSYLTPKPLDPIEYEWRE